MRRRKALLPKLPLLITESADEFDALRDAFDREIKPRGIIEEMYVDDISSIVWEILRLRRAKAAIINVAMRDALTDVVTGSFAGLVGKYLCVEAEKLACGWFKDEQGKERVLKTLARAGFDECAIEGQAIRKSSSVLEQLDRMLASLEARRNRALRCIDDYRLARQLRESSDRMIDGQNVPQLEQVAQLEHYSSEESGGELTSGKRTTNCRQSGQRAQKHRSPIVGG